MNTNTELAFPTTAVPPPPELEKYYTVAEIAEAWSLSPNTVRRLFEGLAGVIQIGRAESTTKRRYLTIRIPRRLLCGVVDLSKKD
jgi:hypothetical protein